jgi:predicted transcriptional regulator
MKEKIKVVIENLADEDAIDSNEDDFCLYNEAGHLVEGGFDTEDEAEDWATENDFIVVTTFNL